MGEAATLDRILAEVIECDLYGRALRRHVMEKLATLEGFDWCGVYRLEGDALVLDEFVGEPTEHIRIPVGQGICGRAVAERKNQVVPDVSERPEYLACSPKTRSEIVVLIRRGETILGQIDIDSHRLSAFGEQEEQLLEALARFLEERWEEPAS